MKDTRSSVVARHALFQRVLRGDKNIPSALLEACKSQRGIAMLSIPKEGIFPMSLNTLKAASEVIYEDGGWRHLDKKRLDCLTLFGLTSRAQPGDQKKTAYECLKEQKNELEASLEIERRFRLRLQVSYDELLIKLRNIAQSDRDLANYLNRHIAGYSLKRLSVAGENNDVK